MVLGLNWITTLASAPAVEGDHDYWNDDKIWDGKIGRDGAEAGTDYFAGLDDDMPLDMPLNMSALEMTVRTDLSRDEHELILTLREYNEAAREHDEAQAELMKADETAADARWVMDDARNDFDLALSNVKSDVDLYNEYGYGR